MYSILIVGLTAFLNISIALCTRGKKTPIFTVTAGISQGCNCTGLARDCLYDVQCVGKMICTQQRFCGCHKSEQCPPGYVCNLDKQMCVCKNKPGIKCRNENAYDKHTIDGDHRANATAVYDHEAVWGFLDRCITSRDCGDDQTCQAGTCKLFCWGDRACPADEMMACIEGVCNQVDCLKTSQCPRGKECLYNRCRLPCGPEELRLARESHKSNFICSLEWNGDEMKVTPICKPGYKYIATKGCLACDGDEESGYWFGFECAHKAGCCHLLDRVSGCKVCCPGWKSPPVCDVFDHCDDASCRNFGICIEHSIKKKTDAMCQCPFGYSPPRCEFNPRMSRKPGIEKCAKEWSKLLELSNLHCSGNGRCLIATDEGKRTMKCHCNVGYYGKSCKLKCEYGKDCFFGKCELRGDDGENRKFVCRCFSGFAGAKCNKVIEPDRVCDRDHYGPPSCTKVCGRCQDDRPCNDLFGWCPDLNCDEPRLMLPYCKRALPPFAVETFFTDHFDTRLRLLYGLTFPLFNSGTDLGLEVEFAELILPAVRTFMLSEHSPEEELVVQRIHLELQTFEKFYATGYAPIEGGEHFKRAAERAIPQYVGALNVNFTAEYIYTDANATNVPSLEAYIKRMKQVAHKFPINGLVMDPDSIQATREKKVPLQVGRVPGEDDENTAGRLAVFMVAIFAGVVITLMMTWGVHKCTTRKYRLRRASGRQNGGTLRKSSAK